MKKILNARLLPVFIIIAIAIISRLPQLLSSNFILDGDECIVGLMAKHLIEGKELPFFFYGQNYGFAFIEVLAGATGFLLAGISEYSLKLSVFALWIVTVIYFYSSLVAISNEHKTAALLFAILLVLCPAWAVWSMKARGGYITGFLFSSVVLYLIMKPVGKVIWSWLLAGVCVIIIFYSQPLWLPGLLPFICYGMWGKHFLRKGVAFLVGAVVCFSLFVLIKPVGDAYWQPQVVNLDTVHSVAEVLTYMYNNATGYYYLQQTSEVPLVTSVFVYIFSVAVLMALILALYRIVSLRDKLALVAVLSFLASVSYLFVIDITSPRYALPVTGYAMVLMFIVWGYNKTVIKYVQGVMVTAMLITGVFSSISFKDYMFETQPRFLKDAITQMEARGITHAYCTGPLLQWQLMFYSKEKIISRYFYEQDRYMPYINLVDSTHQLMPQHTAVFGERRYMGGLSDAGLGSSINDIFYLYQNPTRSQLEQAGFKFKK